MLKPGNKEASCQPLTCRIVQCSTVLCSVFSVVLCCAERNKECTKEKTSTRLVRLLLKIQKTMGFLAFKGGWVILN